MKWPILQGDDRPFFPADSKCPICGQRFDPKFVYLSVGVLREYTGVVDPSESFFLDVGIHMTNGDDERNVNLDIVKDLKSEQIDIYCCSTKCLRAWFMDIVTTLEDAERSAAK